MSPANAAPYLYAVPPDLACFATLLKRFGVRPSFGPSDFCHALRRLAVETGAAEPAVAPVATAAVAAAVENRRDTGGGGGGMVESLVALAGFKGQSAEEKDGGGGGDAAERVARELSPAQVELAVAMVQVLSDESIRVSDLEVWVPDASGVLALSTALLYDDAPWLTKQVWWVPVMPACVAAPPTATMCSQSLPSDCSRRHALRILVAIPGRVCLRGYTM